MVTSQQVRSMRIFSNEIVERMAIMKTVAERKKSRERKRGCNEEDFTKLNMNI
jgi:hypothetical protein